MATTHEPLIRAAFECLEFELDRLDRRWRSGAPIYTIRSVVRAAEDFVAAMLDDVRLVPAAELRPDAESIVHDAYMRVLALADLLAEARDAAWAVDADVSCAHECAIDLLDALAPCASYADRALRRVTLEGLEIEAACAWIGEQQRRAAPS